MAPQFTGWTSCFALTLGILILSPPAYAQSAKREKLQRNYKIMLEKEFMQRVPWHVSFSKALKAAKEKELPLVVRPYITLRPGSRISRGPRVNRAYSQPHGQTHLVA